MVAIAHGLKGMAVVAKSLIVRDFVVVLVSINVVNRKLAVMLWNKPALLASVLLMKEPGSFYRALCNFIL